MGKERFLKELRLSPSAVGANDAKTEETKGDSESGYRKPSPPAEENSDAIEVESETPKLTTEVLEDTYQRNGEATNTEESNEYPTQQILTEEGVTEEHGRHIEIEKEQAASAHIGETEVEAAAEESARVEPEIVKGTHGVDLGESAGDEATPESTPVLGSKAADKIEPRAHLSTPTVLPLGLLGTKKAWIWILVLVCVAVLVYFLWRLHSRKDEVASPLKKEVKTSTGGPVRDFLDDY